MPRRKNPQKDSFRRMQAVSPVPSKRRYAKTKSAKKKFDVYVTSPQNSEVTHGGTYFAWNEREATKIARKRLYASPLLRNITDAVFTAVEVKDED
jgi:hypothetical protein